MEFAENFSTGFNFTANLELNANGNYAYKAFDLRGIVIGNFENEGHCDCIGNSAPVELRCI